MGILITIGAFLLKALRFGLAQMLTFPGMIITAFVGLATVIGLLGADIFRACGYIVTILTTAKTYVAAMVQWLSQQANWQVFYSIFALDTFGEVFTSFVSLVVTVIVLAGFEIIFQSIVIAVPFLIFKTTSKMLKLATNGYAQT